MSEDDNVLKSIAEKSVYMEYDNNKKLFYHQEYAIKYTINRLKNKRGIIIAYGLGTGKTIISREIISHMSKNISSCIVYAPKVILEDHMRTDSKINNIPLGFYPIGSSKIYSYLKEFKNKYGSKKPILVVIDEAHILGGRISNLETYNEFTEKKDKKDIETEAYEFYKELMTGNYKIVMLTGTPIMNNPFSCAPLFNLTLGYFMPKQSLLPEVYSGFTLLFGSQFNPSTTLFRVFVERIQDSIIWFDSYTGLDVPIPKINEDITYLCPMIGDQLSTYIKFETIEKKISAQKRKTQKTLTEFQKDVDSKYHYNTWTRNISNASYPLEYDDKLGTYKEGRNVEMLETYDSDLKINEIDKKYVDNIINYSSKMFTMLKNIEDNINDFHGIFSDRVNKGNGLNYIEKILELKFGVISLEKIIEEIFIDEKNGGDINSEKNYNNFKHLQIYDDEPNEEKLKLNYKMEEEINGGDINSKKNKNVVPENIYEIVYNIWKEKYNSYPLSISISGDTKDWIKNIEIYLFNHPRNTKDKMIRFVLLSSAAAYGLTFKSVKHCHIYSLSFIASEIIQVVARFRRINSAEYLPENERYLNIYRYYASTNSYNVGIERVFGDKIINKSENNEIKLLTNDFKKIVTKEIVGNEDIDELNLFTQITTDISMGRLLYNKIDRTNIYYFAMKMGSGNCCDFFNAEIERDKKFIEENKDQPSRNFVYCNKKENNEIKLDVNFIMKFHIDRVNPYEWIIKENEKNIFYNSETLSEWKSITEDVMSVKKVYVPKYN